MAFNLGRRSASPANARSPAHQQSQDGIPVLSPARQALSDHFAKLKGLAEQLALLQRPEQELREAALALDKAQADLEAIGELEAQAWQEFVAGGSVGERPAPRVDLRLVQADTINEAKARVALAEHAVAAVRPAIIDTVHAQGALNAKTNDRINDVIAEEIERLGAEYTRLAYEAQLVTAKLVGLKDACQARDYYDGRNAVHRVMAGGNPQQAIARKAECDRHAQRVHDAWRKFADVIGINPAAEIDDKDVQP